MHDRNLSPPRPRRGWGYRRALAVTAALASVFVPVTLRAGEFDDADRKLSDLEGKVAALGSEFRETAVADPALVLRRVVDAETLFKLKNYNEAATLLLDVVEKYPGAQGYEDALVLLGESLFQDKDYNSARYYLEIEVKQNSGSQLEQRALERLIEIGLHTEDLDNVDQYLKRLENIPPAMLEPSVPYVRGKFSFFRGRPDEALAIFAAIPASSPYFLQSRYFAATVEVQKGNLAAALAGFDAVTRMPARNDAEKEVQELARLAIGRLHYERGEFELARAAYGTIPRDSPNFEEAMNELSWTSIKAKDYQSAYRALDLMLLQNPDSPQAPELRLLMGNLHVRLGNFALANEAFMVARDQFDPVHAQLEDTLSKCRTDPKYFDTLIGKGMEKFDIQVFIPKVAVKWVRADPEVARVMALTDDVGKLQRGIRDSQETLSRLELAVSGELKVGIFPDLAAMRTRTSEILNQLLAIRSRFVAKMRAQTADVLSGEEKARLEQNRGRPRHRRERARGAAHDRGRAAGARAQVAGRPRCPRGQASELNVVVQGMEAELVAIEQYFIRSRADQKIKPEELIGPVATLRQAIAELRSSNDRIRNSLAESAREAQVAVATGDSERGAIATLIDSQKKELVMRPGRPASPLERGPARLRPGGRGAGARRGGAGRASPARRAYRGRGPAPAGRAQESAPGGEARAGSGEYQTRRHRDGIAGSGWRPGLRDAIEGHRALLRPGRAI